MPVLAETWLRKATQVSDGQHSEAALLFQQIRTKRLYEPLTTGLPIEVKFEEYGRGIFAKEDFSGGQMVWREVPIISAQTSISLKAPACSQCARSLLTAIDYFGDDVLRSMKPAERRVVAKYWPQVSIIECPKCQREKYCSEDCLKAAWYQHHQVLCPKKNKAAVELYDFCDKGELCTEGYWSAPFSPMSVARIWAAVIADVRRAVKQAREDGADTDEPTVEMWAHAKAPYRRFIAYGKAGHAEWAHKMVDLMNRVFNNFPDGINYKIDNREFEGRYYQVACNCQSFSDPLTPYRRFLSRMKVDSNSKHVVPYMASIGEPKEAVFGGLFALHACLNHSCDNDVEILDCDVGGFPGIGVRARRKIAAGQELFSTYIDTRTPRAERRAWLFRAYNFWCQCRRCQFEGDGPEECSHCGIKPEQGKYFLGCANCKRAWYCTPKCQKIAWKKGHKRICKTKHSDVVSSVEEPVREQIRKLADLFYKEMPKHLSKPSESK
ncbi:potential protein lysine methyltransferase SET5-like [Lingula anatina]|uniref:Potential protein lysine methyltransferase SET5-like n=1 Tax=Lingula anatina TaxID=7574 RepID=A0A1S3J6S0_LINAN|nr:potential protein lysine methyltransferase SET5-like [Lingula anatina]|eukprot:XP_013406112.1 potential protein lysine methyltransferase SET5-like [Lingula anatina]